MPGSPFLKRRDRYVTDIRSGSCQFGFDGPQMQAGCDDTAQQQTRVKAGFRLLGALENQRQLSAGTIGSRFLELCASAPACRTNSVLTVVLQSISGNTAAW